LGSSFAYGIVVETIHSMLFGGGGRIPAEAQTEHISSYEGNVDVVGTCSLGLKGQS